MMSDYTSDRLGGGTVGCLLLCLLISILLGCATVSTHPAAGELPSNAAVGAAVFGPDGRLWRLLLTRQDVYIDYSTDHGASYSAPVKVNAQPQRQVARAEDRPSITVDSQGRISVLYFAEGPQGMTNYFSYSTDGGKHFSAPVRVNDDTQGAKHYEAVMAADPSGRLYVFWNDERGLGSSSIIGQEAALFYASTDRPGMSAFPNRKIKDGMCACCRIAVDIDTDGLPVVFGRFLFPGSVRDHGMLKMAPNGPGGESWRVTYDDWRLDACPFHGPALSIAHDGRYHIAWFTQGRSRQGLFYAYSDDQGKRFSPPMPFGNIEAQAGHADVLALGSRVVLVWKEFDGRKARIMALQSQDRGSTWSPAGVAADSESESDHPFLITNGKGIFLSWNSLDHGYRLIPIR